LKISITFDLFAKYQFTHTCVKHSILVVKDSNLGIKNLAGLLGIHIKKLYLFAATQAQAHGALVCRGTPVGNHCHKSWVYFKCKEFNILC